MKIGFYEQYLCPNPSLVSLSALNKLKTVGEEIYIQYNHILPELSGLDNIDAGSINGFTITYNSELTTCDIQSVCYYLADPGANIEIHHNDVGCRFPEEVEAACSNCLPDGVDFDTQEDIDNFQTNFPNCTEVEGSVDIGKSGCNITNLNGLSVLTSIGGDLDIRYCDYLVSLEGLDNVTSIGGGLSITHVDSITNLSGLDNLTSIGGDIWIQYNDDLTDLTGIGNIEAGSINNLYIRYNYSLSDCNIQSICNYLPGPNGTVNIHENAPGCDNPSQVANNCGFILSCLPYGNYYLADQDAIDNFQTDYPGCIDLEGDVIISTRNQSSNITNLNGLNVLASIGGNLEINRNDSLVSLTGLEGLTNIQGSLWIGDDDSPVGNETLSDLSGLDNLTSIGGGLFIKWNPALSNSTGLENLSMLGSDLVLDGNFALIDLSGLVNLTSIGGGLGIGRNNSLINLSGLDNLVSIGGGLTIKDNASLII